MASQPLPTAQPLPLRASAPAEVIPAQLGPLADLPGTWVGKGFNLVALPNQNPQATQQPFLLKVNQTNDNITFAAIGGLIPDRGNGSLSPPQPDISYAGLTYAQQVSDATTFAALHIEFGMWLNVPSTVNPASPATVVRLGTVPHGDSLLAQGTALNVITPDIQPVSPLPTGPGVDQEYIAAFENGSALFPGTTIPPGFDITNPNAALTSAIQGQTIVNTTVLIISTVPAQGSATGGGILNIPFVATNANVTQLNAIFWIEHVQQPSGPPTLQLQYTQTVILSFVGINWPHVSVGTLTKL